MKKTNCYYCGEPEYQVHRGRRQQVKVSDDCIFLCSLCITDGKTFNNIEQLQQSKLNKNTWPIWSKTS